MLQYNTAPALKTSYIFKKGYDIFSSLKLIPTVS